DPPGGPGTGPPRFTFSATDDHGPPGGYGTWRLSTGLPGQRDLLVTLDPIALETCDHRFEASGHDPGVKLRHLTQIRHATCVAPTCRRPARNCDFEHNIPYEAGGRSCLCNGGPTCRHDHRLKQHPRWKVEQITPGTFRRTAPSGRQYTTEPTRYPI
ncbi:MAG TPA: HNH endonuclease signature motif containing protein, partial [Streptosporangiaceae bacterium]|nr:HNH endonuclease signature motif containing protein [Streptosporangiaceae bacterium]